LQGAWRRPTVPTGGLLQPRCCTQRVLQALSKGRGTERCTGGSTVTAGHCCTGGPEQRGHGQSRARGSRRFGDTWMKGRVRRSS